MKFIIITLIGLIFTVQTQAQNACVDIFTDQAFVLKLEQEDANRKLEQEEALAQKEREKEEMRTILKTANQEELMETAKKLVEQISQLETKIEWWSNLSGQYERSALFKLRDKRRKFVFYFETSGELYEAINIYRDTFKNVEMSFFQLKKYYGASKEERHNIFSPEKLKEIEKTFGENYGDYMYVRVYLEGILAKVPTDAASPEGILYAQAKYVLGRLGTPIIAERFEGLEITKERPSIEQIEVLFRATPAPLMAKLQADLKLERELALKTFFFGAFQVKAIQQIVYKIVPKRFKEAVTSFIGVSYNSYVLNRYLSDIQLIVNARSSENQVTVFREMAAKHTSPDFYLTFARLVAYTDTWIVLRKAIEQKKDEVIYARLLEDMKKAEEDLKNYSFLAQFHKPALIDHFMKWIAPGGVAVATYAYADFIAIKQGFFDAYQYMVGLF